jgi:alpha-beta hydrolase superfamily lysophospholipase
VTVESECYRKEVLAELKHLKEKGDMETAIRLEAVLGRSGASNDFEIDNFTALDRQSIYYNKWISETTQHVFIFINGLESHAGWFSRMAAELINKGVMVYGLDRRGSGLNTRSYGGFKDWICDINLLIKKAKKKNPGTKIHLVSVCFGAKLATACAIQQVERFDSLIYLSPGISVRVVPTLMEKIKIFLSILPWLSLNIQSPIRNDKMFTDSPDALYFLYNDKLRTFSPRAKDFFQAREIDSYIFKNFDKVKIPSLVLLAGKDQIVDNAKTKMAFSKFGRKSKIIEYHESEHVIFFGQAMAKLTSDIISFIGGDEKQ